ncbi:MAG TPA: hypothetical protein ENH88_17005 [Pseudoalteromonas prydzensis]|uniref:Uncharacterized protein n=1 Tax=Pseudoalteromonas prydzensis TaxID=182141 RepID=A0A7V1D1F4_9GAMM|nr:hypothetical protein [Pseudoalteromonas prydzensis]HEA18104.1 hypothetical protein [Pseudoalteromonas prydzensis]
MSFLSKLLVVAGLFLLPNTVKAAWLNSTGEIETLILYSQNQILVKLKDNNGAPVAACSNKEHFIIPASYSEESRNRMYSTLLAAKMAGVPASISYSEVDNCDAWGATPNVYRKITRITF